MNERGRGVCGRVACRPTSFIVRARSTLVSDWSAVYYRLDDRSKRPLSAKADVAYHTATVTVDRSTLACLA